MFIPQISLFLSNSNQKWWKNLLFVQTLTPNDLEATQCFRISWYIADDMVFSFLAPWLVCVYLLRPAYGMLLPIVLALASMTFSWAQAVIRDWEFEYLDTSRFATEFYLPPWTRCPPYLIGLTTSIIYHIMPMNRLSCIKHAGVY